MIWEEDKKAIHLQLLQTSDGCRVFQTLFKQDISRIIAIKLSKARHHRLIFPYLDVLNPSIQ